MGTESHDKADFDAIYKENIDRVYRTAMRYTKNHYAAEELTQKVFMKFYIHMEGVKREAVRSWLIETAKNMAMNYKRDSKREVPSLEVYEDGFAGRTVESPENELIKRYSQANYKEFATDMFEELYRLNERWYEAITTTYYFEKSQRDVAEEMGVSLEVLHSMLYRAKKWIKKNYKEKFENLDKL